MSSRKIYFEIAKVADKPKPPPDNCVLLKNPPITQTFQPSQQHRSCAGLWMIAQNSMSPNKPIEWHSAKNAELLRVPMFKYVLNPGQGDSEDEAVFSLVHGAISFAAGLQLGVGLLASLPPGFTPDLCRLFEHVAEDGLYCGLVFKQNA